MNVSSDEPRRSDLRTEQRTENGVGIVELSGDADQFALRELRAAFDQAVMAAGWPLLVVDVSDLDFIDAAGLGALVGVHKRLRELGGALVVCGESEAFQKIVILTGLSATTCGAYMNRLIKEGWPEKRAARLDDDKPLVVTFFRLTERGEQGAIALLKEDV